MRAERFTDALAHHGEGPIWVPSRACLLWVDVLAGDVLVTDPVDAATERLHVSTVASCVVPRVGGGLAIATERGVALLDGDDTPEAQIADLWDDPGVRMNDGGCDPQGRFFCGSMAYDGAPGRGALYRIDPDRSTETILTDVTISNGLAWTADGDTVVYVDSATQRIDAYEYDAERGRFGARRTIAEIPEADGAPDGLTLDAEDGIWVALWGGGAVRRYTADGRIDEVIDVPVPQPSSCAFGGDELADLFISTSAQHLPPDEAGDAGALFVVRPGVAGTRPHRFAG